MSGRLSVVVPARNESARLAATLAPLHEPAVLEVIVVDGASTDGTREIARAHADRVLLTEPGRARQMNAGAREARGDLLLFLHADTRVPAGFADAVVAACEWAVGGRFDVELDAPGIAFRVVERAINLRSRWTGISTGDQAQFVRREIFEEIGGYPDQPLLEDVAMSRRLKRRGPVAALRQRVRTSARRWQRSGVLRMVVLMWRIRALYALGVSPQALAGLYRDVR